MNDAKRLAFFLPNSFTALNLACGFASILYAVKGNFIYAALILVLGSVFDSVDGRVARLTGTQSAFGEQFDSLSDVISFGIAPAVLMYYRFLFDYGRVGIVISFVFLLCGALRLARFNATIEDNDSGYFHGLPIPAAAMAQVGLVLLSVEYDLTNFLRPIIPFYVLFYSFLMISNIKFYSFKKSPWVKKHPKLALFLIFLLVAFTFTLTEFTILVVITIYVAVTLVKYFTSLGTVSGMILWKEDKADEEK